MGLVTMQGLTVQQFAQGTYGSALGKVFNDAETLINNAILAGKLAGYDLLDSAAKAIEIAAENAKVIFADEVDHIAEEVEGVARDTLNQLRSLTDELQNATEEQMADIKGRAVVLVQTIKRSNEPVLNGVSPNFLVVIPGTPLTVAFDGGFPAAATQGYEPRFTFAGITWRLIENTNRRLVFQIIPESFLETPLSTYAHASSGELTVAWDKRTGWFGSERVNNVYRIALTALPPNPGTVIAKFNVKIPHHEEKPRVSGQYSLHGHTYDRTGQAYADARYFIPATPGWEIDTTVTPTVNRISFGNDHLARVETPILKTGFTVYLWVNVHHKENNNNGWVTASFNYREKRDFTTGEIKTVDHSSIQWNETRLLTAGPDEEFAGVDFTDMVRFKEVPTQMGPVPHNDGTLHLNPAGDSWEIKAVPPRTV